MIPVTPTAIQAPWRRSTSPAASGVLTSLTTTMPSIARVAIRSSSRAGRSRPGVSAPTAVTHAMTASPTRIESVLVNASQPLVPPSLPNSRPRRRKKFSTGPWTSPMLASSAVATGAGAYHGRPSDARSPNAAATMKRTLERKPMVRMAGGSISAQNAPGCRSTGRTGRAALLALSSAECQLLLDFGRLLPRMVASLALSYGECQPDSAIHDPPEWRSLNEAQAPGRSTDRQGGRGGGDDGVRPRAPRHGQGEASEGQGPRRRRRQARRQRPARAARRRRGRRGPVLQVRRHGDQGRRRGPAGPP